MTDTQALAEKQSRLVLNTERLGPLPLINHFIQRLVQRFTKTFTYAEV
jgi:hypothetical protein